MNRDKTSEINFLSNLNVTKKWIPRFLTSQYSWKILSGTWKFDLSNRVISLKEPTVKIAENISINGSPYWTNLTFQVKFRILTDSIKPPEGGVILYFLFKNIKNYYSFHFCLCKQTIEFIKRFRGVWSTIAVQDYNLSMHKDYWITISTNSGNHRCQIDGITLLEKYDTDISKGCLAIGAKYCSAEFNHVSVLLP